MFSAFLLITIQGFGLGLRGMVLCFSIEAFSGFWSTRGEEIGMEFDARVYRSKLSFFLGSEWGADRMSKFEN